MNICAVQSFKPLLKFPGALCCTIETSIIHSTILNDSDVFKCFQGHVMYGTSVFYFHFDINLIRFELDHRFLYLLIPLRLVIFLLLLVCLLVGTKWQ